ncbi:MAG: AraC family transcriptional regulator ligand-binding domain-containing protein [Candidatus Korobacteraceae bacterium]|jgi:AraC-like DNA-binding protein
MESSQRVGPLTAIPSVLIHFDQDPAKVIASTGLGPSVLDDAENAISFLELGRLLQACVIATKCPYFGLMLGQRSGIKDLGLVGQLMRNAPTLGRAIYDLCVNQQRYVRGSVVYLSIQEEVAYWGYGIHHPEMQAIEQVYDLVTVMGLNIMLELCGISPGQVRLARHTPDNVGLYRKVFGQMPIFDAEQNALVFSSQLLKSSVRMANPQLRTALDKSAASYWAVTQPSTSERVVRILRARSVCGTATVSNVASDLGIHGKALNRKLHNEGTGFRDLRNQARFEIASQLLTGTRMNVTDIALALGYAETSDFTRAFQSWSGKPPSAWRKQPTQLLKTLESKSFPGNCLKMPSLDCSRCDMVHRRSNVSKSPTFQPKVVLRADLDGEALKKPGMYNKANRSAD